MNKYQLVEKIERMAPLDTQENWDMSGWIVDNEIEEVNKVLFALTVNDNIIEQAKDNNCDMIISHHPLFCVPLKYSGINIYAAHTNLDKASGGTTDTLIKQIGLNPVIYNEFVRIVDFGKDISTENFKMKLTEKFPKLKYVNNRNKQTIRTVGFCAGSGSEFISSTPCDAFVTGDVKFHTAFDAVKVIFDIGHFESEIFIVRILKDITDIGENGIIANEKSPFI